MIIADKIAEERKKNGWSQEELAEKLGVSRQAVSKWESAGSIPDLQKVIKLAELFNVSTDYLLKDEVSLPETPETPLPYTTEDSKEALYKVSMEEANDFLALKKTASPAIANAVSLCILSPVLLIILAAFAEEGIYHISEGLASGLGCAILFGMVAVAVFTFITYNIKEGHFKHLEEEAFETEYGVDGMVKEKRHFYEGTYTRGLALGVVLCIIATVPLIIAGAMECRDYVCTIFVGVLLLLIAMGVNMIIRVCIIKGSYDCLLQEGDYTLSEKKAKRKLEAFHGAYWCLITAIYLGWSFLSGRWNFTWIVWPVGAVLFAALNHVVRGILNIEP